MTEVKAIEELRTLLDKLSEDCFSCLYTQTFDKKMPTILVDVMKDGRTVYQTKFSLSNGTRENIMLIENAIAILRKLGESNEVKTITL